MGHHERQSFEGDKKPTQLLVPPEALEGLPTAAIHDEQRHTLHHSNGIALVAERRILSPESVATIEPANFTGGEDYPHLEIYGNTRLVFRVRIPTSELSKGAFTILARRNGDPIHREVTGFADNVAERPVAVIRPEDAPVTDLVEALIHENRIQAHGPSGPLPTIMSPFDYFGRLGKEDKVKETWDVLLCRESVDGQDALTPEHSFRFGVHS